MSTKTCSVTITYAPDNAHEHVPGRVRYRVSVAGGDIATCITSDEFKVLAQRYFADKLQGVKRGDYHNCYYVYLIPGIPAANKQMFAEEVERVLCT